MKRARAPAIDEGATERKALDAAEAVFAEKGFAAARIDDIAARAQMAKSHLYYHFESKQALLERLIALRLAEMFAKKAVLLEGVTELTPEVIARFIERAAHEVLLPHERFLRIVLLESLGSGDESPLLLRVVRPVLDDAARRFEALGYELDREQFVSDTFFFGLMPLVTQIVLGGRWARAARQPRERGLELVVARLVELQTLNVRRLRRRRRQGGTA